jgi:hypothetical protein
MWYRSIFLLAVISIIAMGCGQKVNLYIGPDMPPEQLAQLINEHGHPIIELTMVDGTPVQKIKVITWDTVYSLPPGRHEFKTVLCLPTNNPAVSTLVKQTLSAHLEAGKKYYLRSGLIKIRNELFKDQRLVITGAEGRITNSVCIFGSETKTEKMKGGRRYDWIVDNPVSTVVLYE